jgi:hypothetical protein
MTFGMNQFTPLSLQILALYWLLTDKADAASGRPPGSLLLGIPI